MGRTGSKDWSQEGGEERQYLHQVDVSNWESQAQAWLSPYPNHIGLRTRWPQPQGHLKAIFFNSLCMAAVVEALRGWRTYMRVFRESVAKWGVNLGHLFTISQDSISNWRQSKSSLCPIWLRVYILTESGTPTPTLSPVLRGSPLKFMVWELLLKKAETCSEVPDSYLSWLKLHFSEKLCLS